MADCCCRRLRPTTTGYCEATNGTLWVLDDVVGGSWSDVTVGKVADGFHDPCGVVVVDGEIFVSHREGIDRLWDEDGDGTFESREVFAQPWVGDNYHHFSFGLVEHEGWIYGTLSTAIYFSNTIKADQVEGSVVSMNGPNPQELEGRCTAFIPSREKSNTSREAFVRPMASV